MIGSEDSESILGLLSTRFGLLISKVCPENRNWTNVTILTLLKHILDLSKCVHKCSLNFFGFEFSCLFGVQV